MENKKAIVIGSGVAGLASALRLAKKGMEVQVFEANDFFGGKINSVVSEGGFRFDRGPSIFTAPHYIKELYELCDEDFENFEMVDFGKSFNYFFNDGTRLKLSTNKKEIIEELSSKLNEDPSTIRDYLTKAKKNYESIIPLFVEKSLHKWKTLLGSKFFKALINIPKYKLTRTMNEENTKTFKNPKTVQIFNRFASYNGSDPFKAPAMLNMICHMEMNLPLYFPKKGMFQITEAIYNLCLKHRVKFHFNEKVSKINVEEGRVIGVTTNKETYNSDIVFSNMDVSFTYEKLLTNESQPQKILDQPRSSSAVVFYWGIDKEFSELSLHNLLFTDDYKKEFNGVFDLNETQDDPSIYINITSKYVEGDAPRGKENWFTMINAPINIDQDWEKESQRIRAMLVKKINKVLKTDIEKHIVSEKVMNPEFIENTYSCKGGSIYGNASNNKYAAFLRHPNFSKKIKGLYFVGVSVHPGGGIPLALNSAKIATEIMSKDFRLN